MPIADGPGGRPPAHVRILEHPHQRVRQSGPAPSSHGPPLPEPHHAMVRRDDLADLRMVEPGYALHIAEQ